MSLRMTYLPNRLNEKLTSVVCNLRFARLRGMGVGGYNLRSENVRSAEWNSNGYAENEAEGALIMPLALENTAFTS